MFHVSTIKNWFKGKAADFNKIAEFLNNLCGDGFIHVSRPDKPSNGSPPTISIDAERLSELINSHNIAETPEETEEIISGNVGSSESLDTTSHTFSKASEPGAKLLVVSRIAPSEDKYNAHIFFREITITGDGRICNIGPESASFSVAAAV